MEALNIPKAILKGQLEKAEKFMVFQKECFASMKNPVKRIRVASHIKRDEKAIDEMKTALDNMN